MIFKCYEVIIKILILYNNLYKPKINIIFMSNKTKCRACGSESLQKFIDFGRGDEKAK